jgi:hypothetical protein
MATAQRWTFLAGMALGGLLVGAGYVAGRSSVAPGPPPAQPPPVDDDGVDPQAAPPLHARPQATRPGEHVAVVIGVSASAAPPAGATLRADEDLPVHAGAEETSPVVGTLTRGVEVRVIEIRGDYRRVGPLGEGDAVAFGWIAWRTPRDAAPQGQRQAGRFGVGTIRGVVRFTGTPPAMRVPKKRRDAEYCKTKEVPADVVVVRQGKLEGVFVSLTGIPGTYAPPETPVIFDQVDCTYRPRIQGAVAEQVLEVRNEDGTLHNLHGYRGGESWFNRPQIKGAAPMSYDLPDAAGIIKLTCDVHPWMRAFVVVTTHPFFAVSGADGSFVIDRVPAGRHAISAWHPHYGAKTASVDVSEGSDGAAATVTFTYDGTEPEPPENRDELKDLF